MDSGRLHDDEIERGRLIALIPHMRAFAQSLCRDRLGPEAEAPSHNAWRTRSLPGHLAAGRPERQLRCDHDHPNTATGRCR